MPRHSSDPLPFRRLEINACCSPRIAVCTLAQNGTAAMCLIYQLESWGSCVPAGIWPGFQDLTVPFLLMPACQERLWLGLTAWHSLWEWEAVGQTEFYNTASAKQQNGQVCPKSRRFGDGELRMHWQYLTPSSLWFCCSHSANAQHEVGPAAEAGAGVKSEPPESGCPWATEWIQEHRGASRRCFPGLWAGTHSQPNWALVPGVCSGTGLYQK